MKRGAIILWMGVVFACGALLGVSGYRLYTATTVRANVGRQRTTPEEARQRFLETLKSRVQTSDDQIAKISAILDQTRERFRETRSTIDPELKRIREEQQTQIRALLSPQQASEWDTWQQERAEQRKKRAAERPARPAAPNAN